MSEPYCAAITSHFSANPALPAIMIEAVTTAAPPRAKPMIVFWTVAKIFMPKTTVKKAMMLATVATTNTPQS